MKKLICSILAALTLAGGLFLIAPAGSDARPPRSVEDKITEARAGCASVGGYWKVTPSSNTTWRYHCNWQNKDMKYDWYQNRYDASGDATTVCWRMSGETWSCMTL